MDKLKPCPFCGGAAKIVLCDDEGNLHDEDYALRPYSGVGFKIRHTHEENPECPIARYEVDGGIVGDVYIYDTEEQATKSWNKRVNNAPVRRGHWIKDEFFSDEVNNCEKCSQCGELIGWFGNLPKYCAGCGALMDGGNDNG